MKDTVVNRLEISDAGCGARKTPQRPIRNPKSKRKARSVRRGFTLIETALATIIVGVGVLALVSAQQGFHQQNNWSTHASIALRLGNEIREMTLNLPQHDPVTGAAFWGIEGSEAFLEDFDDLDDFDGEGDGIVFSADEGNGPVNARREIIANMPGWSQTVRVFNVNPLNITETVDDDTSNMMVVEVTVAFRGHGDTVGQVLTKVSWLAPR